MISADRSQFVHPRAEFWARVGSYGMRTRTGGVEARAVGICLRVSSWVPHPRLNDCAPFMGSPGCGGALHRRFYMGICLLQTREAGCGLDAAVGAAGAFCRARGEGPHDDDGGASLESGAPQSWSSDSHTALALPACSDPRIYSLHLHTPANTCASCASHEEPPAVAFRSSAYLHPSKPSTTSCFSNQHQRKHPPYPSNCKDTRSPKT